MHFNLGSVLRVVGVIMNTIPGAISHVESIAARLKTLSGPEKQDSVVDIVKTALSGAEGITGKDLLDDPEVEAATRAIVDATVALHNVVAKKHGPVNS